jgi:large conductance mechanosensitive channel
VKNLLNEFKDFIMRGNVVDLAIAVAIGAAFTGIVNALVSDIIMPIVAAIGGKADFAAYYFTINNAKFAVGSFFNTVIQFLIVAVVVFFLIMKPLNWFLALRKKEVAIEEASTTRECPYCLSEIPMRATRCAFCTQEVPALEAVPAH